jgi:predicted nucleotidyltransferase
MNYEDKQALRDMRDDMDDETDKSLIKKAINHIYELERKMQAIRVFAKSIDEYTKTKGDE